MASAFIKRLDIVGVEGLSKAAPTQYLKIVNIVGFEKNDGSPWIPEPQYEDLAVVSKSNTTGSTVLGSTLTGTPAVFTGGTPTVEALSQWQRQESGSTQWQGITSWTQDPPSTYTTQLADNDCLVRLASKATDGDGVIVYGSGNNVGPMTPQTIAVTEPTIMTNGTFSNPTHAYLHEPLTMYPATMAGGFGTITYKYRIQESTDDGLNWTSLGSFAADIPTYTVNESDEGDKIRFQTQGKDETGQTKVSSSPASTVAVSTEIGTVTTAPPGPLAMDPGELVGFTAANSGDADPLFLWAIRSGPALITSTYNFGPSTEVTINADASSGESVQVQVTADDPSATDTPQSTVVTILVN